MNLDSKFWEYHKENPHIYRLFKKYANEAQRAGFKNYSAKAVFERLRWHLEIETKDPEGYKLNNNYTARYSRLLMKEDKTFKGFFRIRTLRTFSSLDQPQRKQLIKRRKLNNII